MRCASFQVDEHICAAVPDGWVPGDETECDLLRADLATLAAVVGASDAATPLLQLTAWDALRADFPPLEAVIADLALEDAVLANLPNLTKVHI